MSMPIAYPARLEFQGDQHIARWRPLVHWLLIIPQALISYPLGILRNILTFISFFTVLFTKSIPQGLFDVIVMTHRYQWRIWSYGAFLREEYPPFDFQPSSEDDGVDPHCVVAVDYPEELGRWKPLYKWFLAIPHYVVLCLLAIGAFFAVIGAFFAVLFTARYPEGIRNFVVGTNRYGLRVQAYAGLLTDVYPPFSMS